MTTRTPWWTSATPRLGPLIPALGVLLLSLALSAGATAAQDAGAEAPRDAGTTGPPAVVVEVAGLTCPFCAYGLEKKFLEADGVDSVSVGLEEGEVRLWLTPGGALSDERVVDIVRRAGFTPGEIRRSGSP